MFIKQLVVLPLAILLLTFSVSIADDFSAGVSAYNKGDYKAAFKLWKPVAEQGDASAQFNLGVMYENGKGVEQDYKQAVKWYRLAAEQGDASAQNTLGNSYERGKGVIINYTEAVRLFNLSARQGNKFGMNNLARMYRGGKGVEEDKVYAYMWFNLSDEAGHSSAGRYRENLSEKMTTKELRIAQELSLKCLDSDYKKCESALPNFLHRKFNLSSEDKD